MNDPLLSCDSNPRVTSVQSSLVDRKVSLLIDIESWAWKVDLVRELFNERDAELILSITLNSSRHKDTWFWSFKKSGMFSVKSAYMHPQLGRRTGELFWRLISGRRCGEFECLQKLRTWCGVLLPIVSQQMSNFVLNR